MKIGKKSETKENVKIDLTNLIATRLLIQANSGGGKSWLLRKVLEESYGKVQQIVLDLEGEFSTLREQYDYLICGRDGDIPVNIRTAELLAKKLLELNVSTIVDVSELKKHERILFVKRFLDSLIDAPRKLWHPCIVVVDEAHQFCPQQSKSESTSSVIDLMTRGRKRGFCGILATQRISKLHKDACAESNNRLIGRTGLDIDRKRASEELGFTSKEDERSLRYLEPGEFYGFGPSISKEVIKIKVGDIKTSHPEPGSQLKESSPTPVNIKSTLKSQTREIKPDTQFTPQVKPNVSSISTGEGKLRAGAMKMLNWLAGAYPNELTKQRIATLSGFSVKGGTFNTYLSELKREGWIVGANDLSITQDGLDNANPQKIPSGEELLDLWCSKFRQGAKNILRVVYNKYPNSISKEDIGYETGFEPLGGTFNTYLSELRRNGLIKLEGGQVSISPEFFE